MSATVRQRKPWLAALLAVLITGLGHLYLREWLRAAMWYGFALTAAMLFIPDGTMTALLENGTRPPLEELLPILMIQGLSVVDAYRVAHRRNFMADQIPCPYCGRPLDEDLAFCHWCTTPLEIGEPDDESEAVPSR